MKMFILPTNQSINQQAITNKQQLYDSMHKMIDLFEYGFVNED